GESYYLPAKDRAKPSSCGEPRSRQKNHTQGAQGYMRIQPGFQTMRRSQANQRQAQSRARCKQHPAETRQQPLLADSSKKKYRQRHRDQHTQAGVQKNRAGIKESRGWIGVEINCGYNEDKYAKRAPAFHFPPQPTWFNCPFPQNEKCGRRAVCPAAIFLCWGASRSGEGRACLGSGSMLHRL